MILNKIGIDKSWTLFLDRDGVINKKIEDDYVKSWDAFEFTYKAPEAIKLLSDIFGKIFIVTNQQGIGKKFMTEEDLKRIHHKMLKEIEMSGGKIEKIFHCPSRDEDMSPFRKPDTGMALKAKTEYPDICFERSVMLGDSKSDMEFGRKLNMTNVFISNEKQTISFKNNMFDLRFESLFEFSQYLCR